MNKIDTTTTETTATSSTPEASTGGHVTIHTDVACRDSPCPGGLPSLIEEGGETRVLDLVLAVRLGFGEPRMVRKLIKRHAATLDGMEGGLFQRVTNPNPKGGRPGTAFFLSEAQTYFILAKSGTERSNIELAYVAEVFTQFRRGNLVAKDAEAQARLDAADEARQKRLEELRGDKEARHRAFKTLGQGRKRKKPALLPGKPPRTAPRPSTTPKPDHLNSLVTIHTDGACQGNPGPGGWGAVLQQRGKTKEIFGGGPSTTNNRMELTAAIKGLEALKNPGVLVTIFSDSEYLIKGMTTWLPNWKARNWRGSTGPVKNQDLWKELDALSQRHKVTWEWVKGHNGNPGNERADALANMGIEKLEA